MQELKKYFANILIYGKEKPNRNGEFDKPNASIAIFGSLLRFNLKEGFPLTTSKELKIDAMAKEITWMLRGETNTQTLDSKIWDKWALDGDLSTRNALSESAVLYSFAAIKGKDPSKLTREDFVEASTELFKLQCKYTTIAEGTEIELSREGQKVKEPLTLDNLTPENVMTPGVTVDFDALDRELNEMGVVTHEVKPQYLKGECGPIYGAQWRYYRSVIKQDGVYNGIATDQIMNAYDILANDCHSRRNIVSAWNPGLLPIRGLSVRENIAIGKQALPPCHVKFQFLVSGRDTERELTTILDMRSSDGAVGLSFNIAGYAFITHLFAAEFGMGVGDLVVMIGDGHIYNDHIDGIKEYINRPEHKLPTYNLADNYEAFKLKVISKVITDYVDQAEYDSPEEREEALNKEMAKLDLINPKGRAAAFKLFIDNIPPEIITSFIENYVSEDFIPFTLHD